MAFIVRAESTQPGRATFRAEKTTRREAFEAAVDLMGQGLANVTIADEVTGRVYGWLELSEFLTEGDSKSLELPTARNVSS
jgi:hypothetical protein